MERSIHHLRGQTPECLDDEEVTSKNYTNINLNCYIMYEDIISLPIGGFYKFRKM